MRPASALPTAGHELAGSAVGSLALSLMGGDRAETWGAQGC